MEEKAPISVKRLIKYFVLNTYDRVLSILAHNNEVKKFKDPRRASIYQKVNLTSEQKQKIDKIYIENYGRKVPYIWHRHFTAFTGKFDEKYIPELLYIPEFEAYMNLNNEYLNVFSDKNVLPYIAKNADVRMPETICSCTKGIYRDGKNAIIRRNELMYLISKAGSVFVKPSLDSSSGNGCAIINIESGIDRNSGKMLEDIIKDLGSDFVVQEKLTCHSSLANIYPKSVNTFRIITYLWKNEIKAMPAILRIGSGGNYLDNAHAGGMFIAVDEDGTLHKTAFTEFKKEYDVHPDTQLRYEGYKIELFPKVLSTAKRMHEFFPQIGVINWDFTINEEGNPVLIEMNTRGGSIWLAQMAHGKGVFGDDTVEVLKWMSMMKKKKRTERKKYSYGKTE